MEEGGYILHFLFVQAYCLDEPLVDPRMEGTLGGC